MIEYECLQTVGKRTTRWCCTMELKRKQPPYELELSARGHHFHILFGKHTYGNFLCIPNWDIGCELADYGDTFWNTERLSRHMKKADAISIAQALAVIREYLN